MPVDELSGGDLLLVRPGERVAMDGVVAAGSSAVDQAPITGESMPVEKAVGDEVFAGTINQRGALEVRVTRAYQDNTLSRIIHLVEEAQAQKAPVPAVRGQLRPLLHSGGHRPGRGRRGGAAPVRWAGLRRLVLPGPGAADHRLPLRPGDLDPGVHRLGHRQRPPATGVLFKGGAHLEALAAIPVVAFDKTGTLTRGRPEVTDVVTLNGLRQAARCWRMAAALEARSEHPLAEAVVRRAREEGVEVPQVPDFAVAAGAGRRRAESTAADYFVGSPRLARQRMGESFPPPPALERTGEERARRRWCWCGRSEQSAGHGGGRGPAAPGEPGRR